MKGGDRLTSEVTNIGNNVFSNVSNSISNVSNSLTNVSNVVTNVTNKFKNLNLAFKNSFDVTNIENVNNTMNNFNITINQADSSLDLLAKNQDKVNEKAEKSKGIFSQASEAVGGFIKKAASMDGIKKVMDISDSFAQTTQKLNNMNDGLRSTDSLQQMVFESANRSRMSYTDTADIVSEFGKNAGGAFGDNQETLAFSEALNKQFLMAGQSQEGVKDLSMQVAEAMNTGAVNGDLFNSIFSASPAIMQNIADYMGVSVDKVSEMASQGQISAEVLKNSMLASAGDIESNISSMPMTWADIWTGIVNNVLEISKPLLEFVNLLANNWKKLSPIIFVVTAALVAYNLITMLSKISLDSFNLSLLASPLTWLAIIIGVVIFVIYKWIQSVGGIEIAWMILKNMLLTAWESIQLAVLGLKVSVTTAWNNIMVGIKGAVTNILNFIGDLKASGLMLLQDFVNGGIDMINDLISAVNSITGTSFKLIDHVTFGTDAWADNKIEQYKRNQELDNYTSDKNMENQAVVKEHDDAEKKFAVDQNSRGIQIKIEQYEKQKTTEENTPKNTHNEMTDNTSQQVTMDDSPAASSYNNNSNIANNVSNVAENTGAMNETMEVSGEDLKYMRDIAEKDAINKFTTAEIKVDMANYNNINGPHDTEGIITMLRDGLYEAMNTVAEGV